MHGALTQAKPAAGARPPAVTIAAWTLRAERRSPPRVRDLEFTAALDQYLGKLQMDGRIEGWRLLRSKLGLGRGQ